MSGKISKIVKFYNDKESKTLIAQLEFDQLNVPLTISLPPECKYFECYSQISDEVLAGKKMLTLCSDKLNLKGLDFSLAEQNELPKEIYVAVCLKELPTYQIYINDEISIVHNIGYGKNAHADFTGEFDQVQHPKELSFEYVKVPSWCNRFEMFDTVSETVATNNGDVKLLSEEKLKHKLYYIGNLEEVKANTKTVFAKTCDGQPIICSMGELIDPKRINKFGRIAPAPATPEM